MSPVVRARLFRVALPFVVLFPTLVYPQEGDRPALTPKRTDVKPFEYLPAKVPYYPRSEKWGVIGEPFNKMQKPLDATQSLKHYVTPVGFEVRLFVSEERLGGKPICMNWDERGRLWVALTVDYPNELQPEGQGRDRIVVCEDTDGDGQADKVTTFADKLSIPTSLIPVRGGLVVHQAPHTLFLKDTNGDDVADERRVLFTGWITKDTHAGPSNLQYGFDNWLYGIVGYSGFEGTIGGEPQSFRTGFYRFKPDGSKLEFLRNTNNNSWGVGFSEEGILFGSTANGNPSNHLPIPNRYYEAVRGWSSTVLEGIAGSAPIAPITENVRQVDHHGRFTAAAGHALYTARVFPKQYWNRTAFVTEGTGHLIATFVIEPQGASFRSRNAWNLLASDDEWASPSMAEVGPDGTVWVIDWYNFIYQHNPTPPGYKTGKGNAYETDLRDKKFGRVYRIVPTGFKPTPFTLKDATPEKLVATLKHDNLFWRRQAQRLLVERGNKDVAPALVQLAGDTSVDGIGLNPGVIHALWTLHGLNAIAEATTAASHALKHPSAGVRLNAVQVLPRTAESFAALKATGLHRDSDAQVRLQTFLALAEMPPSSEAAALVLTALQDVQNLTDRWLSDALTCAAARHDRAVLVGLGKVAGKPSPSLTTLVQRVTQHLAAAGDLEAVLAVLDQLPLGNGPMAEAVMQGLALGWPPGKTQPLTPAIEKTLETLLPRLTPAARGNLVTLTTRWGSKVLEKQAVAIAEGFLAQARDDKASDAQRITGATALIDFRKDDAAMARQLLNLVTPQTSPELARGLIEAVGRSEARDVGAALVEQLAALPPTARSAAIHVLLARTDWVANLLDAVDKGQLRFSELSLDQKQRLTVHPNRRLAERARKLLASGGGLPNPDRQKVVEELMPLTQQQGDAVAGKAVFKNQCAKCHQHSGEGANIGPDLTGMAVHSKAELLVHILDPNRDVEGNFRQYIVSTRNGRLLSGMLASETKTAIELIDTEAKKQVVQRAEIEELQASNRSLMPEGFEKQVSRADLSNLLAFLTQRGRYLPLPLNKAATVVSTRGLLQSEDETAEPLSFPTWEPKTFQGVPFNLVDPQGGRVSNVILLRGATGNISPRMPDRVALTCNAPAKAIHLLSGISAGGFPGGEKGAVTVIVRLHYADGTTEDHELKNGEQFADYRRPVEVPASKLAYNLDGRQVRYLAIQPRRPDMIKQIEFRKGPDKSAPVVLAVTVELPS